MNTEVRWIHNDDERRWELGYKSWVLLSYVTDEFLADADMPGDVLKRLILEQFKLPLPAEAYEQCPEMNTE